LVVKLVANRIKLN